MHWHVLALSQFYERKRLLWPYLLRGVHLQKYSHSISLLRVPSCEHWTGPYTFTDGKGFTVVTRKAVTSSRFAYYKTTASGVAPLGRGYRSNSDTWDHPSIIIVVNTANISSSNHLTTSPCKVSLENLGWPAAESPFPDDDGLFHIRTPITYRWTIPRVVVPY